MEFNPKSFPVILNGNLGGQGFTAIDWFRRPPKFKAIHINPLVIAREAGERNHWFYTDFVYTLIRENTHAERFFADEFFSSFIFEEHKVYELTFKRFQTIYGEDMQPLFSSLEQDDVEDLLVVSGWTKLKAERDRLKDSTDPDD